MVLAYALFVSIIEILRAAQLSDSSVDNATEGRHLIHVLKYGVIHGEDSVYLSVFNIAVT